MKFMIKKTIANEFNDFFSTIGQKISDNIPPHTVKPESLIPDYNDDIRLLEFGLLML